MNELWVVRSHWKTLKVGSRIWDAQKHGLERRLWQQPARWTATGESVSRGIHELVGVMVQGFAEKMERKNLMTEFSVCKSQVSVSGWHGTVRRWCGEGWRGALCLGKWKYDDSFFQMKFRRRTYGYVACEGPEHLQVRSWQTMVRNWLEIWIWSSEERSSLRMENLDFVLCISVMFGEARESWSGVMWECTQES